MRAQKFTDTTAPELLFLSQKRRALSAENASAKPRGWLLDLDSTLFSTSPRTKAIFGSFLRAHPSPPFHWQWLWPRLGTRTQRYKIDETFASLFSALDREKAEGWARELWKEFEPFWFEHFFGDRWLAADEAHPGAPEFVWRLMGEGLDPIYLTARERMKSSIGTLQTLRSHGFPAGHGTHLVMKLREGQPDLAFKEAAGRTLASRFDVQAVVDNEPENLAMFAKHFPDAMIVFYHSVMSDRVPAAPMERVLGGRPLYRIFSFE